jgi:hypothetical protein
MRRQTVPSFLRAFLRKDWNSTQVPCCSDCLLEFNNGYAATIELHYYGEMRILPDARDLINLTEHGRPVGTEEFCHYLEAHQHQIVLSFTNIRELAGPLARRGDFLQVRRWLQALEAMPHLYLQEATIIGREIESGVHSFNSGIEYQPIDIYATRWDRTLMMPPGQQRAEYDQFVGLRLDNIVYDMFRSRPQIFAPPEEHLPRLVHQFEQDRERTRLRAVSPHGHFINAFRRHAQSFEIQLPAGREEELARWVYANPIRCPGTRLHHETYRQLMANEADVPEVGDFSDLAHIFSIPYVEAATLDNRMRAYCAQASHRLSRLPVGVDYRDRLYRGLAELIERNP